MVFEVESTLQLIVEKGSLVTATKNITESLNRAFQNAGKGRTENIYKESPIEKGAEKLSEITKGLVESFKRGTKGAGTSIYGYEGPGAGTANIAGKGVKGLGDSVGKGMSGIMTGMTGKLMGALGPIAIGIAIISSILEFIQPIFKLLGMVLLLFMIPVFRALKPFLKDVPDKLAGVIDWLTKLAEGFFSWIGSVFSGSTNLIEGILNFLSALNWSGIIKGIVDIVIGLAGLAGNIIIAIVDVLAGLDWNGILNGIWEFFGGAVRSGGDLIKNLFNALPKPIKDAWKLVINAVTTAKNIVFGADGKSGLWGAIATGLAWAYITIFGEDGKSGVWGDIKKALTDFSKNIMPVIQDIIDGLTRLAGILGLIKKPTRTQIGGPRTTFGGADLPVMTGTKPKQPSFLLPSESDLRAIERLSKKAGIPQDFISRPGMGVQPFSANDTIIGFKGKSPMGKGDIKIELRPTYHISAGTDRNELKRIFEEHDRKVKNEITSAISYVTNLRG